MADLGLTSFLERMHKIAQLQLDTGLKYQPLFDEFERREAIANAPKRQLARDRDFVPPFIFRSYRNLAEARYKRVSGHARACLIGDDGCLELEKAYGNGHVCWDKELQADCIDWVIESMVEGMLAAYPEDQDD